MAWIESHDAVWEHHKTIKMASLIKPFMPPGLTDDDLITYCGGALNRLWHFTLRNAWRNADLEPWGDFGIEKACRWSGESGKFVKALRDCGSNGGSGYMDGYIVHGWMERAGKLVADRVYNETRRNAVLRRKPSATVPNPTLPNLTIQQGSCSEQKPSEPTFLIFPCIREPKEFSLTETKTEEYAGTYTGVDVRFHLRRAWQWCQDHPAQRKTARGMPAFLSRWLTREQDRGGSYGSKRTAGHAAPVAGKYGD